MVGDQDDLTDVLTVAANGFAQSIGENVHLVTADLVAGNASSVQRVPPALGQELHVQFTYTSNDQVTTPVKRREQKNIVYWHLNLNRDGVKVNPNSAQCVCRANTKESEKSV